MLDLKVSLCATYDIGFSFFLSPINVIFAFVLFEKSEHESFDAGSILGINPPLPYIDKLYQA